MPASGLGRSAEPSRVVLRRDADDDAGVGVALVARVLAHAVGDHAARLGGRGDHRAARAHAEAVDRAAVAGVVHQLVVGGAEQRVAGVRAEARAVDQRLRMLDAKADRERLGLAWTRRARAASAKVSRALWPSASTTWSARNCSSPCQRHAAHAAIVGRIGQPRSAGRSTRLPKRISPPSASISARIFSTMPTSRNVPMCGLLTYRISSGAPALTNSVEHLAAVGGAGP